jgi:MFS family permease
MSPRAAAWLAWSLCAATLAILALSLLLILLGWSMPQPRGEIQWRNQAISLVGLIGAPILGGLIASRRPRNPYGWLWLVFGLGLTLQQLAASYTAYVRVVEPGSLVAPRAISHGLALGGPLALSVAPFLLLLFPTGRLPSRRWRPLTWIATLSGAMILLLNLIFHSPDRAGGWVTAATIAVVSLIFIIILLSALSLVVRYHRASGVERQQLKWVALAAVLTIVFTIAQVSWLDQVLSDVLWNLLETAQQIALYVAVGVAILRHRLYDVDVVINRALVYVSVTATLLAVYFGGVVLLQRLLVLITGQESTLAIVASTLVIAALFNPLRGRIQSFIDRRFYRRKYDARKTLEAFSATLREETDLHALNGELTRVVRETMQPAHVSLWLRPDPTRKGTQTEY